MSTYYRKPEDIPNEVLAARLNELVKAAVNGDWTQFYMRIPCELDHDADCIMAEAARRIAAIPAPTPTKEG